ncbi:vWA domain-containing protein [Granulosicoccus sp. 3-233]|uniref:vWA domain-containing protein n=1 Tax=Granulosicoccus sp. 3-233 TaxID=3417969 RepID=UPI003D359649
MNAAWEALSWMRPLWLWGFVPLLLALLLRLRANSVRGGWDAIVEPALQPYVIEGQATVRQGGTFLLFAAWALALLLLAGPVWQQREVPVFEAEQAQLVLFDLSRSMLTDDLPPNRLTRARFKLTDLLRRSQGRQTGLIAFAERPYVISPLTDDAATIEAFVPSLSPEIMPVQGSRPDLAIERALQLFAQASVASGHILLISDAPASSRDVEAARLARQAGYRVSVLAVGTAAGAPLRGEDGQFLQHANGSIVVPQLDMESLRALAVAGGGSAVSLSTSAEDLDALDRVLTGVALASDAEEQAARKIYWVEYSPWLLWPLLVVLLLAFRRGVAA